VKWQKVFDYQMRREKTHNDSAS